MSMDLSTESTSISSLLEPITSSAFWVGMGMKRGESWVTAMLSLRWAGRAPGAAAAKSVTLFWRVATALPEPASKKVARSTSTASLGVT
ncbi:hypothetical protein D3C86_1751440 [compost metagenome]